MNLNCSRIVSFFAASMLTLVVSAQTSQPAGPWVFEFGPQRPNQDPGEGATRVAAGKTFSQGGYGFDLGSTAMQSDRPVYFSLAVPEGTYKVTVTLGGSNAESITTVKAETHRLMLEAIKTAPGESVVKSFYVNVHTPKINPPIPANAPGRPEVTLSQFEARNNGGLTWDEKLTLEFLGTNLSVKSLQIEKAENVPTIFIAGDSTVTDQAGTTTNSWGQMLPRFFPNMAVANYAESGETMKSFMSALRFDKILSQIKKGDYLFIQFGHNDSKANWPQTYAEAGTTYNAYLKVYIAEARRRGAIPVLINPMQRRGFDANGKVRNSHGQYPQAVAQVAKEENVPFVNLTSMSEALYEAMGQDGSAALFGNGGRDATHHSPFGAYELAKCIVQALKDSNPELAKQIAEDFKGFDPAKPDDPKTFAVPESGAAVRAPTTIMGN
jgi:lysophospholipase L1-like esterase